MEVRTSYIAATRNRADKIHQALPLWKALKGPQDELLVVDGASDDGTYDLLRGAEPGLIDILIHEKDRGEAHAINKGFLAARGRYIKVISDDDAYYREGLEQAYRIMDENPHIDLLVTGGESIDQVRDPSNVKPFFYQWFPDSAKLAAHYEFVTMNGQGIVLRRSSLPLIGLYNPRHLHADTSYLTQATVHGACMRYLRVKGYSHRVGKQSNSLHNVRKKYIYKDFGFTGLSRWRYLKQPGQALLWFLKKAGLISSAPVSEPVWDGRLMA